MDVAYLMKIQNLMVFMLIIKMGNLKKMISFKQIKLIYSNYQIEIQMYFFVKKLKK